MYDELIKRLRVSCESCKLWDGYKCCLKGECSAQKSLQAADAIENLQKITTHYEEESKGWWLAACDAKEERERLKEQLRKEKVDNVNLTGWLAEEHAKHLWIPVTERLPECDLGAEVGNIEWIICGMVHSGCFGRGGKYRDAYFRTWTDAGEGMDAKDADYWRAVTLPEPPKDGES